MMAGDRRRDMALHRPCLRVFAAVASLASVGQGCAGGDRESRGDGETLSPGDAAVASMADAAASPPRKLRLVDHLGWTRFDAQLDPLAAHQPAQIQCPESAAFVEFDAFEVDTTRCNYVLAQHGSRANVPVGTTVSLTLLHYDLLAPEPAQAHIAILFGSDLQWETTLAIPATGRALEASFVTTRALAMDEPIRLHLHNHGGNTYLLYDLEVTLP